MRVASLDETLDRSLETCSKLFTCKDTLFIWVTAWPRVRSAVSTLVETFDILVFRVAILVVSLVDTLPTSSVIREFKVETSPLICSDILDISLASLLETFN